MGGLTIRFKGFSLKEENVEARLSMVRPSVRATRAFEQLHRRAAEDMLPYMPGRTGAFQQRTAAANAGLVGSGQIYAGVGPMGSYLYRGMAMVDAATGKGPMVIPGVGPRFRRGASLVPSGRPLHYSAAGARPAWFEAAKSQRLQSWVDEVQDILDGK